MLLTAGGVVPDGQLTGTVMPISRRESQGQLEYHLLRSVPVLTVQFGLVIDDLPE